MEPALLARLAALKSQEALMGGGASPASAAVSSTDATAERPSAAPEAAPASLSASSLKMLELKSGMEGGAANGAYMSRLRSGAYYAYASPPPLGLAYLSSPPPVVSYVKEVVTTVTTTYPAPEAAQPREEDGDVEFEPYDRQEEEGTDSAYAAP